jgi:acetyltransferase-like isoleucine patch superfamily enzyme
MHRKGKFIMYCWQTSKKIIRIKNQNILYRYYYFIDLIVFGFKYNATTIDYMKLECHTKKLTDEEKEKLMENKAYKSRMDKERIILSEYTSSRYENHKRWHKRNSIYKKTFNMGESCWVQYNVWIRCTHNVRGKLIIGNKVSLRRNLDLDYTGDLIVGNNVDFTEGVKVLTHGHDFIGMKDDSEVVPNSNRAYLTPLEICDNVIIGTNSVIMPGVKRIGVNSIVSANSVVIREVPDNTIVAGHPAKVIFEIPEGKRAYLKT